MSLQIFRSSRIDSVLLAGFFVATTLLAGGGQAMAQTATSSPADSFEVYSTVNIQNATVTSQNGNNLTVSFDISNLEGVQPGARYGVSLVTIGADGALSVADEHVYDETLTLGTNQTVHRVVTYIAPANLSGSYSLFVSSKSSSGIPFATTLAGKITLQGQNETVAIDLSSCFLTLSGEKAGTKYSFDTFVSMDVGGVVSVHCVVTNTTNASVTLSPKIVQRSRSTYGDIVPNEGAVAENIVVAPQSTKEFTIDAPHVATPQKYYVALSLSDALHAGSDTNAVHFRYALRGTGASIRTVLLDKDAYATGDTAIISMIWSSLIDTVKAGEYTASAPLTSFSATFSIMSGDGKSCGAPVTSPLSATTDGQIIKVPYPISANCLNPKVQVDIADVVHGVLDTQEFSAASRIASSTIIKTMTHFFTNAYVVAGAAIIALLLFVGLLYKRSISAPLVVLLVASIFLGGARSAHANSAVLRYNCTRFPCPQATSIFATGNLDRASYAPGQTVVLQVSMISDDNPQLSSGVSPIAKGYINAGGWSPDMFPSIYSAQDLRNGIWGSVSLGAAPAVSGTVFTYYGSGGYVGVNGSMPLTVVVPPPPPSVNIFFSLLDNVRSFSTKAFASVQSEVAVRHAYAKEASGK